MPILLSGGGLPRWGVLLYPCLRERAERRHETAIHLGLAAIPPRQQVTLDPDGLIPGDPPVGAFPELPVRVVPLHLITRSRSLDRHRAPYERAPQLRRATRPTFTFCLPGSRRRRLVRIVDAEERLVAQVVEGLLDHRRDEVALRPVRAAHVRLRR